jgi:hypothetical protein
MKLTNKEKDILNLALTKLDEYYDEREKTCREFKWICNDYLPQAGDGYVSKGLAKVAIFTTNVDAEKQTLINHKCVCGTLNRHFCQTRVRRSAIFPPTSPLHFFLLLKVVLKCPKPVRYIFCLWSCSLVKTDLKFLSTSLQFQ